MTPQTFIFIGRSGSGKGTQSALLKAYLEKERDAKVFYLETGEKFRQFIEGKEIPNKFANEIYNKGERQPDFLAVWMWGNILLRDFDNNDDLIADGFPRSVPEAVMLDTALKFFRRENPIVIHLGVSVEWSRKHLLARKRMDDLDIKEIETRLDWYQRDVVPVLHYFKEDGDYFYLEMNGEQPVEKVHRDIINSLPQSLF